MMPPNNESSFKTRHISSTDYSAIIAFLNKWWGGRQMSVMLPKSFFTHFCDTIFVVKLDGRIIGFLAGLLSQSNPTEAYIHFVGIHPDFRQRGIGSILYQQFFQTVQALDRAQVKCVISPLNKSSIG
jgi:ribosomal protein S18 acetylase RimI-like enzyme